MTKNNKENTREQELQQEEKIRKMRSETNASHGDDPIEIEKNEGKKFTDSKEFGSFHGDLGDETEDFGDLPLKDQKAKNHYDSATSAGAKTKRKDAKKPEGMNIESASDAGVSYRDRDSYTGEK